MIYESTQHSLIWATALTVILCTAITAGVWHSATVKTRAFECGYNQAVLPGGAGVSWVRSCDLVPSAEASE